MPVGDGFNSSIEHPVYNHPSVELFFNGIHRMDNPVGMMTYVDYEEVPVTGIEELPMLNMRPFTKSIELRNRQMSAAPSIEAIQDLNAPRNDHEELTRSILTNEHIQTISRAACARAFELGEINLSEIDVPWNSSIGNATQYNLIRPVTYKEDPWQWFLNIFRFKENKRTITNTDNAHLGSPPMVADNIHTLQMRCMSKIRQLSNMISMTSRRGPANTIVCSARMATVIQDCSGFTFAQHNHGNYGSIGPYNIGVFAGLNVYLDPVMQWDDDRVLIFRKGNETEPGLSMCFMNVPENTQVIGEYTFSPRLVFNIRESIVETGFKPHQNYVTARIDTAGIV